MVTAPAPVDNAVREPKLSALRIENEPHEKISSYHRQKLTDDLRGVLVQCIDRVIHPPHLARADASTQPLDRFTYLGILQQRLRARDRRRVVRRKVVAVVIQLHEVEGGDEPGGRVAG